MISSAPVLPGETLGGKYKIERVLGQGGMGVVVAARHLELDERVAIKFLVGEPSEAAVDRFLREARATAKVKGEHVCRVFDFGRLETGEPYIVMEYLEGTDLARKLEQEGPQSAAVVVGWIVETCDALAEAHALGIVHRDLKPANVFLATRPDGSACAKVLDFGISKLPRADAMTRTAALMGSPAYMSPEQMESSRDVDARSDIWSLGIMIYELLAGQPPFVAASMVQLAVMARERDPEPLESIAEDVPSGLVEVVMKCLAKKPSDRYASVAELATALAPFSPPEVAALVARLARRVTPTHSHSALAFRETAAQLPAQAGQKLIETLDGPPNTRAKSTPPTDERAQTGKEGAHLARARGTFAPLQSTLGGHAASPRSRRVLLALVALGVVAVLVYAARGPLSSPVASPVAPSADASEATLSASHALPPTPPEITSLSANVTSPPPPSATATSVTAAPTVTATLHPAPPTKPISPPPASGPSTATPPTSAHPVATALSSSAPKEATQPGPKKRELDREDP